MHLQPNETQWTRYPPTTNPMSLKPAVALPSSAVCSLLSARCCLLAMRSPPPRPMTHLMPLLPGFGQPGNRVFLCLEDHCLSIFGSEAAARRAVAEPLFTIDVDAIRAVTVQALTVGLIAADEQFEFEADNAEAAERWRSAVEESNEQVVMQLLRSGSAKSRLRLAGSSHKAESSTDDVPLVNTGESALQRTECTPEPVAEAGDFSTPSWVMVDLEAASSPWVEVEDSANVSGA